MRKKPRELPKMDPEKFRITTEGISGESKGFFLKDDGTLKPMKTHYGEIVAHDMFWWKCRAYLSTVSYVTISEPNFFGYQACENFADLLHDVILAPTQGGRLQLAQCKVAWKI